MSRYEEYPESLAISEIHKLMQTPINSAKDVYERDEKIAKIRASIEIQHRASRIREDQQVVQNRESLKLNKISTGFSLISLAQTTLQLVVGIFR